MNKGIKIAIATTLVGVTIGGTLIGVNNLTTKHGEPIRRTTIVKTNENAVRIDYKEIILEELVTTKQIIVATNK